MDALAIAIVRPALSMTREPIDARIRRALDRVAAEYDQAIGVDELAAAAELPRFAFLRAFRAQVGESPYRYLILHRLERAAELLRQSQASVLDVALACGFNDPGRFARLFRDRFGSTPLAYRRQRHDSLRG